MQKLQPKNLNKGHVPPIPLVLAPTAIEYTAVQKGLKKALAQGRVRLIRCGVGERQSALVCQKIDHGLAFSGGQAIRLDSIACLVLLGWAGGLAPDLAVGEVVCADAAQREGQPSLSCDTLPIQNARRGPILTAPAALLTPMEKSSAQASGALAVEMEAYPIADWAEERGLPFMHARVIMDTVDETLPDFGPSLNSSGQVRIFAFLKRLAQQQAPEGRKLLRDLWWLTGRIRALNPALEKLARDAEDSLFWV
jgi:nucleoside phosphorylase